ncbi:hypothetical protein IKD57_02740 [Candidatus Saccharibacteria bacterium]|nr:hypothetical protein [Candidatus Saccharibacteria bacterium]
MDITNIFTVTPMNQQITLERGKVFSGSIQVSNPATAAEDFSFQVKIAPYGVEGNSYDANLVTDTAYTEITKWITIKNPAGTLKPNEVATVDFEVNVPEDAPIGGQYAALLVSFDGRDSQETGVSIKNKFELASLLYAMVDGEVERKGEIIENSIPGFVTEIPIKTNIVLKNDGNVHETAKIGIEVRSFFSPELIYPKAGESGALEEVVMPGTTRDLTQEITNIAPLGIYEVTQTVLYMGSDAIVTKQIVVACPVWFMFLVAATIAVITTVIVGLVKHNKRKREVL